MRSRRVGTLDEQRDAAKLAALQMVVDAGDASGVVHGDVFARVREAFGLDRRV